MAPGGWFKAPNRAWEKCHYSSTWSKGDPAPDWWVHLDLCWMANRGMKEKSREMLARFGWSSMYLLYEALAEVREVYPDWHPFGRRRGGRRTKQNARGNKSEQNDKGEGEESPDSRNKSEQPRNKSERSTRTGGSKEQERDEDQELNLQQRTLEPESTSENESTVDSDVNSTPEPDGQLLLVASGDEAIMTGLRLAGILTIEQLVAYGDERTLLRHLRSCRAGIGAVRLQRIQQGLVREGYPRLASRPGEIPLLRSPPKPADPQTPDEQLFLEVLGSWDALYRWCFRPAEDLEWFREKVLSLPGADGLEFRSIFDRMGDWMEGKVRTAGSCPVRAETWKGFMVRWIAKDAAKPKQQAPTGRNNHNNRRRGQYGDEPTNYDIPALDAGTHGLFGAEGDDGTEARM